MSAVNISTEPIYYEVSTGIEHNQSQTYVDNRDGSFLSEDAEARATRAWLALVVQGVAAGFFVNGKHKAGCDFATEYTAMDAADVAERVSHETRTFLHDHGTHMNWRKAQIQGDRSAWAKCTCGWSVLKDTRELARRAARRHGEPRGESR